MNRLSEILSTMSPDRRRTTLADLPTHLAKAQYADRFHDILTQFPFLDAKVIALGPQPLIEDYDLPAQLNPKLPEAKADTFQLVQETLQLSAHILTEDPHQLLEQLTGRLTRCTVPGIHNLLDQAQQGQVRPWLRPLFPSFPPLETC